MATAVSRREAVALRKFTPPDLLLVVARPRLFRLLDEARGRSIIWVSGPPGSGKTTLIASYLQARGLAPVWYHFDESDREPATYFQLLGRAVERRIGHEPPGFPRCTSQDLGPIGLSGKRYFAALFGQLNTPRVLVLDDYHLTFRTSFLHSALWQAFSELPNDSLIFVISRSRPPAGSVLARNRQFWLLDWEDLRLSRDEAVAIARLHGDGLDPEKILQPIAEAMEDWVAGLVLCIAVVRLEGVPAEGIEGMVPEVVFDYFGREVLLTLDSDSQRFLVQSALLPRMTASTLRALTGEPRSALLLANLLQRNCFIRRSPHPRGGYQYQRVFKRFLVSRLHSYLDESGQRSLQQRALRILERTGALEDVVPLLVELGDQERLAKMLERAAPELLDRGRYGQLVDWIDALSASLVARSTWLQCWRALGLLASDPRAARRALQRAYQRFHMLGNAEGWFRAGFGIVQSYWIERGDFRPLHAWLNTVWTDRGGHRESHCGPECDYAVVATYAGLILTEPTHPSVSALERQLPHMTECGRKRQLRLFVGVVLLFKGTWLGGGRELAEKGLHHLRGLSEETAGDVLAEITRAYGEALYRYWFSDDLDACLSQVETGLATAERGNVHGWDGPLLTIGAMALLAAEQAAPADLYLGKLAGVAQGKHFDSAFCDLVHGWHHWLTGARTEARKYLETALSSGRTCGELSARLYPSMLRVQLDVAEGAYRSACQQLARIRCRARSAQLGSIEILGRLTAGLVALRRGQTVRCDRLLAAGFRCWRLRGYRRLPCFRAEDLAELCNRALDAGIETHFVQGLIRGCRLPPPSDALANEHWPWPIKIYCLGEFSLSIDGQPIRFSRKPPKRVLSLLQALVALDGLDVPQTTLMDALWPGEDADAAQRAFKTTLSRLRQLLLHEVIRVHKGRVSVQPGKCWVDVLAFEHFLDEASRLADGGHQGLAVELISRATSLYRGDFLPGQGAPWAFALRARLRQRAVWALHELGRHHDRQGGYEKAIGCYQRALQFDGCAEKLYQRLMVSYQRLGRTAEALAAYRRCKRLLSITLNVQPSPSTEDIRRSLSV